MNKWINHKLGISLDFKEKEKLLHRYFTADKQKKKAYPQVINNLCITKKDAFSVDMYVYNLF